MSDTNEMDKKVRVLHNTPKQKGRHWFMELTRMVGWMLLMIVSFILFFQILPIIILAFGHMSMLFGNSSQPPSVLDIMVYIPSSIGLSGILTYFLYRVLKMQYRHVIEIQAHLSVRFANRELKRKERKANKSKK